MRSLLLALSLCVTALAAPAQETLGTITILEGQAQIYRALDRVQAAEGVRLAAGDIVETAASTFAQIEMADRSVMQFGPSTRVLFNVAAPARQKPERALYVMDGWLKLSSTQRDTASPAFDLKSPAFEIAAPTAVLVLRATPAEIALFVEAGELRLVERAEQRSGNALAAPNSGATLALRGGDFYQRKPPARGAVAPKAAAEFLGAMPRSYRDSLPSRLERFRDRPVTPREAVPLAYADLEVWLKAEPALRRPLMQRWRPKAREAAFRSALVSNLSSHPEWDPILFPEKYKPPPPRPAPAPAPAVLPASAASAPSS